MHAPYGLKVVGGASSRREVVSFDKAIRLYASADPRLPLEIPTFLSAFRYTADLKTLVDATESSAGYAGPIGIASINFDLDRLCLDDALNDVRRLVAGIVERWSLDTADLLVAFSGSKGFHISIPVDGIRPAPNNNAVARRLATSAADAIGLKIDEGVYLPTQLWRAPNTRHNKTGLFKVIVDADDLLYISADAVRQRAALPIPFDLPNSTAHPAILREWRDAANAVQLEAANERQRRETTAACSESKINALTWVVIREGADEGDRHRMLFSCAANLAGFSSVDDLVTAILTPVGLDMGLSARDVARQIKCGIEHVRCKAEEGNT